MQRLIDLTRRGFIGGLAAVTATTCGVSVAASHAGKPAKSQFTAKSSDGVLLAVEAQGDSNAPEIVFIHGLRQSRLSWARQFDEAALAGFRMVRFDLRGHGDSDKPTSTAAYSNLEQWGDDVAAVIAAAKLRRPVLVGWSLGGAVTGGYLMRHGGDAIAGINLVDAVTKFTSEFLTPLSGEFAKRTSSHGLAERSAATAEFLLSCYEKPPKGRELEGLLVMDGMTARAVTEGLALARADLDPPLRNYKGPLLLTHGARDRLLKVAMSRHNQELHPGARLSIYPGIGHSPFYEDAPRFNRELAAFVTRSVQG